jgi:murein DD-endopeptidase MepM/ murein hydrolase activator NlpD
MFEKLEDIQQDIESKEAQLEIQELDLENLTIEANNQKKAQEEKIIEKNIEMEAVLANQEMLEVQKVLWEEEEAQIDEDIKEAIRLANELQFSNGTFIWPAPACHTTSSDFGVRVHPITGKETMHNGIDIPASYGSDVLAAASGKVIKSYYSKSYGNLIVINHGTYEGSTYVTYYAHNSELLYNVGDVVTEGTVIAKVGSTGYSTGNHLHFGVLKDGVWVNPIDYFEYN